ncbi:DUF6894 family protein [Bradyrhizobium tunisiense]|uniref:DUF6894 family protein n=1 Tax=Bradyrhizobium tunisiense TaxID=3278709 RepID=UPI0035E201F3
MPLFFFDFTSGETIEADDIGTVFPSLEEAYLDACRSALEMSFEKLRMRRDPNLDSVEILDAQRHSLMQVPFSDVLRPNPQRLPAARDHGNRQNCNQLIDSCNQQLNRGHRLKAEIGEELRKMRTTSAAIRAKLELLNRRAG